MVLRMHSAGLKLTAAIAAAAEAKEWLKLAAVRH